VGEEGDHLLPEEGHLPEGGPHPLGGEAGQAGDLQGHLLGAQEDPQLGPHAVAGPAAQPGAGDTRHQAALTLLVKQAPHPPIVHIPT